MLVKDCMTRHPIMVAPESLASEAQQIMTTNNVRHLPVVKDGKRLVGLITPSSFAIDADALGSLNVWEISRQISNLRIKNVMTPAKDIVTATPNTTVERAARMLNESRQNALVIVEDDNIVVGVVSIVDIMNTLQEMLGLPSQGVRVTIRMPNKLGEFKKITTALAEKDWGIMGIGTYPSPKTDGDFYDVVLKLPDASIEEVQNIMGSIPDQEIVDIRDIV